MKTCRLALALGGVLAASGWAAAAPGLAWGVQAGLQAPLGSDLRYTTGSGLNPALGLHMDWNAAPEWGLRTRADLAWFSSGDQQSTALSIQQAIHTRVRNGALGEEWLWQAMITDEYGKTISRVSTTIQNVNIYRKYQSQPCMFLLSKKCRHIFHV